jgi:sugar phosphate isomerase/epimerase
VVHGLREAAYVAGEVGARLALEVVRPGAGGSLVATIPQALEMIADIGLENVDVLVDTWHSGDTPTFVDDIRRHVARIAGVQISDRAAAARGPLDRALPGRGAMDPRTSSALRESGFNGWYELEIFSDDGTFGDAFPDSSGGGPDRPPAGRSRRFRRRVARESRAR